MFSSSWCKKPILLQLMKTLPNKQFQGGFTIVEIVAVMVLATILAAFAIPRMMSSSDVAAKVTADRVLAAMHIAQTLAQRQGVATSVEITAPPSPGSPSNLAVKQGVSVVILATQNYNGADTSNYSLTLHPDAIIDPSALTITYGANGIPTAGAGTTSAVSIFRKIADPVTGTEKNVDISKINVEPTGFAHFVE